MAKAIQIVPYSNEITIDGNTMHTDFAGGITYTSQILEVVEAASGIKIMED